MKISKQNAAHYIWGAQCDGWHLVQNEGLSIIHECMPAGTDEIRHYHNVSRQFFFILSGVGCMELDGVEYILEPHEGLEIPPGVPHQMQNTSANEVEFLVVSLPGTHGDRIELTNL
ncbi:cupin domain-containing protein [Paenibacillus xylanilyticus]|uniref:cupin domain-containing protein n=1 Tax=Paenibacillus xylanilyticus TaxID=248903 RepID=UPI00129E3DE1|nr:cupin domain-containing protein [Paenibacillus xylanilyticus]